MDRRSWFIDFARIAGRKNLYKYFVSVIKSILSCNYDQVREEAEIFNALDSLNEALAQDSLPWDVTDAKKASAPTEAEEKKYYLDCIITVTGIESLMGCGMK